MIDDFVLFPGGQNSRLAHREPQQGASGRAGAAGCGDAELPKLHEEGGDTEERAAAAVAAPALLAACSPPQATASVNEDRT